MKLFPRVSKQQGVFILFVLFIAIVLSSMVAHEQLEWLAALQYFTLFGFVFQMSWMDWKERIIPNRLVLLLLLMKIPFLFIQLIQNGLDFAPVLQTTLFGFLFGGGMVLLLQLLSRNGIGAGDVKMFAAIGAFLGWQGILSLLFFSFMLAAIAGLYLLGIKKASLKATIPMAPFTLLGLGVQLLLMGVINH